MANKAGSSTQDRKQRSAAVLAAEKRRQRSVTLTIGAIVAVVIIVLGLLVAKSLSGQKSTTPSAATGGLASAAVTKAVSNVPASVSNSIGVGLAQNAPKPLKGAPPLTSGGKPRVLYVGSDFCPYCAAERWSLAVAMARFGSFKNLGQTSSSDTDAYPGTNTLSFHGSTYTSSYLAFSGYELQNRDQTKTLDKLPKADQALLDKYDAPPYVSGSSGAIPFIDIGGKYVSSGASFDPGVLKGLSHAQIAQALSDPNSKVAKSVVGSANLITAELCKLTNGKPANVCTSPGVKTAAATLG